MTRPSVIFLVAVCWLIGVANGFHCPDAEEDSITTWVCELVEYWKILLEWKETVERECDIRDPEEHWQPLFECPEFSEITCLDELSNQNETSLFNCTFVFCKGESYSDKKEIRRIYRHHFAAYKRMMNFYKQVLRDCTPTRACQDAYEGTNGITTTAALTIPSTTSDASGSFTSSASTTGMKTTSFSTVAVTATTNPKRSTKPEETTMSHADVDEGDGNWTVFQRRQDGSVDFYRNWTEYANGFGDLKGEFWLGLEAIHNLTKEGKHELRIELIQRDGTSMSATYSNFSVGSALTNYTLTADGYFGNATDAFANPPLGTGGRLNQQPFSTYDVDNDNYNGNCAEFSNGGWWYNSCQYSNLNGLYHGDGRFQIMRWFHQEDEREMVMRFTEMKTRPKV